MREGECGGSLEYPAQGSAEQEGRSGPYKPTWRGEEKDPL